MAWYCLTMLWYRGRLFSVNLRYGYYRGGGGARLVKGKPIVFTERDHRRIEKLVERKPATERRVAQFCEAMNRMGI